MAPINNRNIEDLIRLSVCSLFVVFFSLPWIETALLIAIFVLVPKAAILGSNPWVAPRDLLLKKTNQLSYIPAVFVAISFAFNQGLVAALLVLPWLLLTIISLICGLRRIFSRTQLKPNIISDIAFIYISVGGAWLFLSRLGCNPLGFSDDIVKLTAVHFHYAGFIVPIVVSQLVQKSKKDWIIPALVTIGIPLTALGITVGGVFNLIGALTMASAGLGTAFLLLIEGSRSHSWIRRFLLVTSSISLSIAMMFAASYALSLQLDFEPIALETMARWHGSLNALGFGVLALWGLSISDTNQRRSGPISPRNSILWFRRPNEQELNDLYEFEKDHSLSYQPKGVTATDQIPNGFKHKKWKIDIGHGEETFSRACEAMKLWKGYDAAKISRAPNIPKIEAGECLTLTIPALGIFYVTAMCEIVEIIDEEQRFGFAYGTMNHHPECGEERFVISISNDPERTVSFKIGATFKHNMLGIKLVSPLTSYLQNRAINKYLSGIKDYVVR